VAAVACDADVAGLPAWQPTTPSSRTASSRRLLTRPPQPLWQSDAPESPHPYRSRAYVRLVPGRAVDALGDAHDLAQVRVVPERGAILLGCRRIERTPVLFDPGLDRLLDALAGLCVELWLDVLVELLLGDCLRAAPVRLRRNVVRARPPRLCSRPRRRRPSRSSDRCWWWARAQPPARTAIAPGR
jgi:hypothetical protein